jgi:hypothetical protein
VKKHILGVYLSAIVYNSQAALDYFQKHQMLSGLMTELLGLKTVRHNYERKLILVGLSQMFLAQNLP